MTESFHPDAKPNPSEYAKAEHKLHVALGPEVTPAGEAFVRTTLDPFSDVAIDPVGFPDGEADPHLVIRVQRDFTFSAPLNADGTGPIPGNWCLNAFTTGWNGTAPGEVYDFITPVLGEGNTPRAVIQAGNAITRARLETGMITVVTAEDGTPTWYNPINAGQSRIFNAVTGGYLPSGYAGPYESHGISPVDMVDPAGPRAGKFNRDLLNGRLRMNSLGFEGMPSGSMLLTGGVIRTYRQSSGRTDFSSQNSSGFQVDMEFRRGPPATLGDATALSSVTLGEKLPILAGNYSVAKVEGLLHHPARYATNRVQFLSGQSILPGGYSPGDLITSGVAQFSAVGESSGSRIPASVFMNQYNDFDTVGIYVTGIPSGTSYTITMTVEFEKFPILDDDTLLYVSRHAPPLDLVAIRAVSTISASIPAGVARDENFTGGFFGKIADAASALLPMAGPKGMMVAKGLGMARSVVGALNGKAPASTPKKKKKQVQKPKKGKKK